MSEILNQDLLLQTDDYNWLEEAGEIWPVIVWI